MIGKPVIERVSPGRLEAACRCLARRFDAGRPDAQRVRALRTLVVSRLPDEADFWWSHRGRRGLGSALVLHSPGRTGSLMWSPSAAEGIDAEELSAVISRVSQAALSRGLSLVQALPDVQAEQDMPVLEQAGYRRLAELQYMKLDLSSVPDDDYEEPLHIRQYAEYGEQELKQVIESTYVDSMDCPGLSGLRDIDDVLAGHRATGVFTPQRWWIVDVDGTPAGCILVNECLHGHAEVVYLGVVPEFRGLSLGRRMVTGAARQLNSEGFQALTLAVDVANTFALRAYGQAGMVGTNRRYAYISQAIA